MNKGMAKRFLFRGLLRFFESVATYRDGKSRVGEERDDCFDVWKEGREIFLDRDDRSCCRLPHCGI